MVPKHVDKRASDILRPLWSHDQRFNYGVKVRTIVSEPSIYFSKLSNAMKPASCTCYWRLILTDLINRNIKLFLNADASRSVMRPHSKPYIVLNAFVLVPQWSK